MNVVYESTFSNEVRSREATAVSTSPPPRARGIAVPNRRPRAPPRAPSRSSRGARPPARARRVAPSRALGFDLGEAAADKLRPEAEAQALVEDAASLLFAQDALRGPRRRRTSRCCSRSPSRRRPHACSPRTAPSSAPSRRRARAPSPTTSWTRWSPARATRSRRRARGARASLHAGARGRARGHGPAAAPLRLRGHRAEVRCERLAESATPRAAAGVAAARRRGARRRRRVGGGSDGGSRRGRRRGRDRGVLERHGR